MSLLDDLHAAGEDWRQVLLYKDVIYLKDEILSVGTTHHRKRLIFAVEGKYYAVEYMKENTEYEDPSPKVAFYEVVPVTKKITGYSPVVRALEEDW